MKGLKYFIFILRKIYCATFRQILFFMIYFLNPRSLLLRIKILPAIYLTFLFIITICWCHLICYNKFYSILYLHILLMVEKWIFRLKFLLNLALIYHILFIHFFLKKNRNDCFTFIYFNKLF
jgi:hypothetical protein